jgi:hypothetical protein
MQTTKRTGYIALVALFTLALVISTMSFVLAEESQDNTTDSSSITPIYENPATIENTSDLELNDSAGDGKIAWRQFKLWFTFNQEKKIEGELDLARLRLIQARRAAENNNSEGVARAMDAHQRIMDRIQERMNRLDNHPEGSALNDSATKLVGLERAIQVHERRINFLNDQLENANLTDEQRARIEDKISKAQNVTSKLNELEQAKLDKLKTRIMAVANLTDEQADQVLEVMKQNRDKKFDGQERGSRASPRSEDGKGPRGEQERRDHPIAPNESD